MRENNNLVMPVTGIVTFSKVLYPSNSLALKNGRVVQAWFDHHTGEKEWRYLEELNDVEVVNELR